MAAKKTFIPEIWKVSRYADPLNIQSRQRFCYLRGLRITLRVATARPRPEEGAPLLLYYEFSHQRRCLTCFYFFNMTYLVLNNLWKLFGNSEQTSSHSAWKQKINEISSEIWDQNQVGFMAPSETYKKSRLELRHSILTQSKSRRVLSV